MRRPTPTISLSEASKHCQYSQEYLSLRARQGKLKAIKQGRNWVTTRAWLKEYVRSVSPSSSPLKLPARFFAMTTGAAVALLLAIGVASGAVQQLTVSSQQLTVIRQIIYAADNQLANNVRVLSEGGAYWAGTVNKKQETRNNNQTNSLPAGDLPQGDNNQDTITKPADSSGKALQNDTLLSMDARLAKSVRTFSARNAQWAQGASVSLRSLNLSLNIPYPSLTAAANSKQLTVNIFTDYFAWLKKSIALLVERVMPARPGLVITPVNNQDTRNNNQTNLNNQETITKQIPITNKQTVREQERVEDPELTRRAAGPELTRRIAILQSISSATTEAFSQVLAWKGEIDELKSITSKLQSQPPSFATQPQIINTPVYIGTSGLQVGGSASFESLGVSGSAGVRDLGVGRSASIGKDQTDTFNVNASSTFTNPVVIRSSLTVGTGTLTIDATGALSTTASVRIVDSTGATKALLDNAGTLTVSGALTSTSPSPSVFPSLTVTGNTSSATFNSLTLTSNATGFSIAGGTTSKTLTLDTNLTASSLVLNTRILNTTLPLSGGGDLSADRTLAIGGLSTLGTANSILGVNSDASAWEYKSIAGTTNQITLTHGANSITLSAPQDIATSSSPTFANLTLSTAGALRTSTTATSTLLLQAYDTDGVSYTTFATLTAGTTPTFDLSTATTIGTNYIYRVGGTDVSLADGGTGASLTASNGGVFYSTATAGAILAGTATANQALLSGSTAAPAWSTATYPATTTVNQLLYSSSTNVITGLVTGNSGVLVTGATGIPAISTDIPTAVTIGASYIYRATGTDITVADGGTGVSSWTNGQLLIGNTTGNTAALGTLTGTSNQITVTNGEGSITLSTPQDIATSSSPTFANMTLSTAGALRTSTTATNTLLLQAYDTDTGPAYTTFATLTAGATPTFDLSTATTVGTNYIYRVGGTDISLADGGTNASLTASNGGIFYSTATAGAILAGTATANQALLSGLSTTPAWSTATYPATTTVNQLLYSSSADVIAGLATGNSGILVTSGAGVPSIATDIPTAVTIGTAYIYRVGGTDVPVADGGTGVGTFASNGVLYGNGADAIQVTAQGGTNTILTASAGAPAWSATPIVNTSLQIGVASTATGQLKLAHASSANLTTLQAGNATAAVTYTLPTTDGDSGQILTTNASGVLGWTTVSAGSNVWSELSAPTADLSTAHAGYTTALTFDSITTQNAFALSSSSLTTGTIFNLSSTSTAGGVSGSSKMLNISRSGTNSNASHTAYGVYSSVTNTGTTSTNVGLYATASGATNNYAAVFAAGNVGIGVSTPAYTLDVAGKTSAFNSGQDGSLGAWSTNANALPQTRFYHSSVVANGYVYVISGDGTTTVYYAKLNSDGSTGAWSTNANALPASRESASSVVANGYVYIIGGGSSSNSTVYYAKLNSDGSTGAWSTNTNVLPEIRKNHSSVVANGYVYVIGGYNTATTSTQSTVYYAKLNSDGSTGVWKTDANALPAVRADHSSVVANGYVYVIGGFGGTTTVYYAKLNSDGSTGAWSTNANVLPAGRYLHSSVAANGYVYAIAGAAPTAATSIVYAKINSDGSTGAWSTNADVLPGARYDHSSVYANGYVYVIGGHSGVAAQSTVYYASTARMSIAANIDLMGLTGQNLGDGTGDSSLGSMGGSLYAGNVFTAGTLEVGSNAQFWQGLSVNGPLTVAGSTASFNSGQDGSLGAWSTNANALPVARWGSSAAVTANGYVYVIGGSGSSATVYYARINSDGSTGAWSTNANALPVARHDHSTVVANGYVYVIGGQGPVSTVYYARINSDGSTGAWSTNGNTLPAARYSHSSVVANGYVYVIGGYRDFSEGVVSTVYYAKLNSNGSTGGWSTNANALPAGRQYHSSVIANGYVYVIGGYNSPSAQSTVYYAKLNSDGSTGAWSTNANTLPAARWLHSSVVANGYVYVIGGPGVSTIYYAKLNSDGSTGAWSTNTNALPEVRQESMSVVANGYVYVIGGQNVSTVYYASTARVSMAANLDLIGMAGRVLGDSTPDSSLGSAGGSIYAGNIFSAGTLEVGGNVQFWQGLSANGHISTKDNVSFNALANTSATTMCGPTAGAIGVLGTCSSSLRYKEDIQPLTIDTNTILSLEPVSFKWKNNPNPDYLGVGFIAEDVQTIIPDIITYDSEGRIDGLEYRLLTPYIIGVLKEHQQRLNILSLQQEDGSLSLIPAQTLRPSLSAIGLSITQEGTLSVQTVQANKAVLGRIEMKDRRTGDTYCRWIQNGEWISVKGECGTIAIENAQNTNSLPTGDLPKGDNNQEEDSSGEESVILSDNEESLPSQADSSGEALQNDTPDTITNNQNEESLLVIDSIPAIATVTEEEDGIVAQANPQ